MGSKFKVGEKVAVYTGTESPERLKIAIRSVGRVVGDWNDELIRVEISNGGPTFGFHPKQCRRLVKKPRRRVWIDKGFLDGKLSKFTEADGTVLSREPEPNYLYQFVEFIEARPVKKREEGVE